MIICENGGYDASELITKLSYDLRHKSKTCGLNMDDGEIGDMLEKGIFECLRVKE